MGPGVINKGLAVLPKHGGGTRDLTSGASELNSHFRGLVVQARALGVRVIDRYNLAILEAVGQKRLADFLAGRWIEIVASLPCYSKENADKQHGDVFGDTLVSQGAVAPYRALLKRNYLAANPDGIICWDLVSADWQDYLYDGDFIQILGISLVQVEQRRVQLSLLLDETLDGSSIQVADHHYGCSATQSSRRSEHWSAEVGELS